MVRFNTIFHTAHNAGIVARHFCWGSGASACELSRVSSKSFRVSSLKKIANSSISVCVCWGRGSIGPSCIISSAVDKPKFMGRPPMVENWVIQIISWLPELFGLIFKRYCFSVINTKLTCFPFNHVPTDRVMGRICRLGDRLSTVLKDTIGFSGICGTNLIRVLWMIWVDYWLDFKLINTPISYLTGKLMGAFWRKKIGYIVTRLHCKMATPVDNDSKLIIGL